MCFLHFFCHYSLFGQKYVDTYFLGLNIWFKAFWRLKIHLFNTQSTNNQTWTTKQSDNSIMGDMLNRLSLLFTDRPPGAVLGQSGAAVLRHAEARDVPIGGDIQPLSCGVQTHVGDSRAGTERLGASGGPQRIIRRPEMDWDRFLGTVGLLLYMLLCSALSTGTEDILHTV